MSVQAVITAFPEDIMSVRKWNFFPPNRVLQEDHSYASFDWIFSILWIKTGMQADFMAK
jgi:hypothetical protein